MNDKMDKEVEYYKALRLVTSNNYVRAVIIILVLVFLDDISLRFFGADIFQIVEGWNPD